MHSENKTTTDQPYNVSNQPTPPLDARTLEAAAAEVDKWAMAARIEYARHCGTWYEDAAKHFSQMAQKFDQLAARIRAMGGGTGKDCGGNEKTG